MFLTLMDTLTKEQFKEETKTKLEYLLNTYQFVSESTLKSCESDEKGKFLIFESTIFHPQGGGQPSDAGSVTLKEDSNRLFAIKSACIHEGVVKHYLDQTEEDLESLIGKIFILKIDENKRMDNAKSHSAGHIISSITESIDKRLHAKKSYHFPDGPNIEFNGIELNCDKDEFKIKVQEEINQVLKQGAKIQTWISKEENEEKFSKMRFVQIEGYEPRPCGGTHLKNANELKTILIKKISMSKDSLKVSYTYS